MGQYERYLHHGKMVWVRTDLRGKHREFSLCHKCALEGNCPIIALVIKLCELVGVTLPVWECVSFQPKAELA